MEVAAPKPAPKAAPKATSTVPKGAEVTQGGESKYRCHPVLLSASDVTSSNAEGADEKFDAEVGVVLLLDWWMWGLIFCTGR